VVGVVEVEELVVEVVLVDVDVEGSELDVLDDVLVLELEVIVVVVVVVVMVVVVEVVMVVVGTDFLSKHDLPYSSCP
jgi:hypothetical protein